MAGITMPQGVAIDAAGNIYIADVRNNRIRKVDASGVITTVAGIGTTGYSGDGGPATSANLGSTRGVALDASGNIYIADTSNNRIRKVDASGVITTVAGNGIPGYSGDGGPATMAGLNDPNGVAVDSSNNIYIADISDNRIRKVDASGIITTVAGNGAAGYSGDGGSALAASLNNPNGVSVDASGNIYIADTSNNCIRMVDTLGVITTLAAGLHGPTGVAVDGSGNIYIADSSSNVIRILDISGIITTVAGNGFSGFSGDGGPATAARLNRPSGVAVDAFGNIYIVDYSNQRIRKVDAAGIITTVAGTGTVGYTGDGGPATSASISLVGPPAGRGVAVDVYGSLYIADSGNHRVRMVGGTFTVTPSAGANGSISPSVPQMINFLQSASFTITPNTGYHIASVTGCGGTLNGSTYTTGPITEDCMVSASFAINTYALVVMKAGTGTVSSSPAGISCGSSCSATYNHGTIVTLTAASGADSFFAGWSGGGCSGIGTCDTTMDAAKTVTATFSQFITVTVPNGGERWTRGTTYTIRWNYAGNPGSNVKIELLKGGVPTRTIANKTSRGSGGSGSYNWKVPNNQAIGSDYTIRVTSTSNSNYKDTSNTNFTIQ